MSRATVEQLIGKLMLDAEFRRAVVANPAAALAGYDLTEAELGALGNFEATTFEAAAHDLESRLTKGRVWGD